MKRKKKKALILSVFMILLLAACSSRTNVRDGDDYIYCLNPDKTGLVKVSYEVQGEDVVEEAKDILREMQKPADETRYTPAISKKIKVQDCKLRGSILDVDFNSEYRSVKPLEEKLMRAAIVQSLLRLDGVNAVSLSVDGEPLKNADGAVIGLMNEDDFVENTGSSLSSYQSGTLTLYFANKKGDKLVEQKMDVRYSSNVPKEKLIVEKLMQGPTGNGAYPTINPDTNLLSVTIKDHVCYVNFDSTFLTSVYDVLPEITIYSLVDSIIAGTEATQVQITINGETTAVYMEKIDLSQPLEKDMDWFAVNDDE